jgi:hypothetical protein
MSRENDISRLARQRGFVQMTNSAVQSFRIGTLKNNGGKVELWNLHLSDQAAIGYYRFSNAGRTLSR